MEPYISLQEVHKDLSEGKITCEQITRFYLGRIENEDKFNAFLEVFNESAIAQAKALDKEIAAGKQKKLTGMVVAIKDNMCYRNHHVSASSRILEGFESLYTATAVQRLIDEGAIIIGRLNCDEFAMGSSNENSAFGPVLNPLDIERTPGGSSGGSAAAVKAGLCMAALGSDTGGSIRQPASFCGLVGLKPTYGRVSRYGLIAYASSFDQIGPLTNRVEDAAILLEVMAGKDEFDSTASSKKVDNYSDLELNTEKKYRIAYFDSYLNHEGLDPEIKEGMFSLIDQLRNDGHEVEELNFDSLQQIVPTYYVITTAECSSNLARYDGIHFGYRSDKGEDIQSTMVKSRSEGFGKEVKRRVMLGTYVLSAGYYDAYFGKAQKVRRKLKNEVDEILKEFDFILTPTSPHTAFKLDDKLNDPIKMYLEDIFTAHFNLTGHPAISLPMGVHNNGLPYGVQIAAGYFEEHKILKFSQNLMNKYSLKRTVNMD